MFLPRRPLSANTPDKARPTRLLAASPRIADISWACSDLVRLHSYPSQKRNRENVTEKHLESERLSMSKGRSSRRKCPAPSDFTSSARAAPGGVGFPRDFWRQRTPQG